MAEVQVDDSLVSRYPSCDLGVGLADISVDQAVLLLITGSKLPKYLGFL